MIRRAFPRIGDWPLSGGDKQAMSALGLLGGQSAPAIPAVPWYLAGDVPLVNVKCAYQPRGAASLAASYINLANPGTNDAAPGSAPTWDKYGGWTFNGSSNYLTTGITPASGWSVICKFSDMNTNGGYVFGCANSSTTRCWLTLATTPIVHYGNGQSTSVSRFDMYGVYAVAGTKGYKNAVEDATMGAWSGTGQPMTIGAVNTGSLSGYANVKVQFFAMYNTILTPTQVAAITAAINTADAAESITLPQNLAGTPAVIFHFDDNDASVYTQGYSFLLSRNAPISMSLITNNEQTAAKLEKLKDQQARAGFDFVNHTTDHLTLAGGDLATQTQKIGDAQTWLNSNGFHGDYFVPPQASRDSTTDTAVTNLGIKTQTYNNSNPYDFDLSTVNLLALNRAMMGASTSLATAKGLVDTAKAASHVLTFECHQLVTGAAVGDTQYNVQDFKDLVDYCIAQSVPIITVDNLYRLRSGAVAVRAQV